MNANHRTETQTDCETIRPLIPDYAFGLADRDELRMVEAELAHCPDAQRELADFRQLQAAMRASVPQIEPPATLGDRLMAALGTPTPALKVVKQTPAPTTATAPTPVRSRSARWAWIAASIAIVALIGSNLFWLAQVNDLNATISAQTNQRNTAFIATNQSDIRWVRLPPAQTTPDASAFLMWNAESKIGILYVRGLPQVESGKSYLFWLRRGTEFANAGVVTVDADGKGVLLFHIDDVIDKYTWAWITEEPAPGGATPTGTPVVSGKLTT